MRRPSTKGTARALQLCTPRFSQGGPMADMPQKKYTPMQFPKLKGLKGMSDTVLEMHFKLYEGYVNEHQRAHRDDCRVCRPTGRTPDRDAGLLRAHAPARVRVQRHGPARVLLRQHDAQRRRRCPRARVAAGGRRRASAATRPGSATSARSARCAGSAGRSASRTRRTAGSNHWITLHEDGNIAGFRPVLVMDVWEHAFLLDYKPAERAEVHRGVLLEHRLRGLRAAPK